MDFVTEGDETNAQADSSKVRRAEKIDSWPGRVTQNIARQVRRWRRERRLTTQGLSDATAALGSRVPRSVLTNLENDRRDYVSVAELLIISAALNVPPVVLVAPIGDEAMTEVLPGVEVSPWRTRGWLMGALAPRYEGFSLEQWNGSTVAIKMFDRHRLLVRGYQHAQFRLQELDDDRMEIYPGRQWPEAELNQRRSIRSLMIRQVTAYLDGIRNHRREMEALEIMLPALPPEVEADLSNPVLDPVED